MRKWLFAIALTLIPALSGCEGLPEAKPELIGGSGLRVEFIDVGQADSILIICEDGIMLIDGGNAADSDLIYTYLKDRGITRLDYVVATHAHEDHIGGLPGALEYAEVGTALCPVTDYDSNVFDNFVRALDEQGVGITVPDPGDTFTLGGAEVEIIGPVNPSDDPNDTSIVMRLTYGETSFLFTGDAEREAEQDILDAEYDLSATVLKVGHHGSDTSTSYPFLREVMPQYVVISCGTNNSYGHPRDDLLSRLRDADVTLYRTDMQGTVNCVSDGETVSFTVERNANQNTNPTQQSAAETHYIGNVNSRVFHRPSCSGLPAEKNRITFDFREDAVGEGYKPCGICEP